MNLLDAIRSVTTDIPDVLTMDAAIYVRKRRFAADSLAKIAPADDEDDLAAHGWHMLDYVMFVQQRALDGVSPEDLVFELQMSLLLRDRDRREIIEQVVTAQLAADLFGVQYDTAVDACQQGHIFAMKSAGTWLMLRDDAEARWGKREKSR